MGATGRIFDIQRFSLHDGPGIRTIVFFKGCSLRCAWCSNPESQRSEIQEMRMQGKPKTVGEDASVETVMDTLLRDEPYYRRSGGGVTLSGGEALLQPEFARALLAACKEEGLHTAIETAAHVPWTSVEAVLPVLDLVLLDIKHMDSEKHARFIGQPNGLILENARHMAPLASELVVRVPVIPGFNDTTADIREIAAFAASLRGVKALHLLPYHRLGRDKYAGLNRPYPMGDAEPPSQAHMETLAEAASQGGLFVQIGG
ncbi:MAG TPA: glycyl-radical enzyme activating protein [Clostridia bacterium]|nr:glycyl-radical enzyme activating protein [Clostridia bacterium]